jgi:hypothetical protein
MPDDRDIQMLTVDQQTVDRFRSVPAGDQRAAGTRADKCFGDRGAVLAADSGLVPAPPSDPL